MQHYTEQTWDPKVIQAISAFVIIREVPAYQDRLIFGKVYRVPKHNFFLQIDKK